MPKTISNQLWMISCLLLCAIPALLAQARIDSLTNRLNGAQGTERVDALNQLAFELIAKDATRAENYCGQAMTLSDQIKYPKGKGIALIYCGVNAYLSGEFKHSRKDMLEGLALVREANDREMIGYAYLQMGNSYLNQTELDSSLFFYDRAYEILKDSTNPLNLSKLYRNLGTLYGIRGDVDLQVKYIEKALRIRELLGNKQMVADALVELGRLHARNANFQAAREFLAKADGVIAQNRGDLENLNDSRHVRALCLLNEGAFDEAFVLLDSALTYYIQSGLALKKLIVYIDLGSIFTDRGEYELALTNYYAGLKIAQAKSYIVEHLDILVRLGWVNYHLGEYTRAEALARQSLKDSRPRKLVGRVSNALTLLGVTLTETRRYAEARKALQEALEIRQSTHNNRTISEGYMNLAYLNEREGKFQEAARLYHLSIQHAEPSRFRLILSWSALGLGNIALSNGDYKEADRWLKVAENHATQSSSNEVLIRVFSARREMLKRQGLFAASLKFAERVEVMKDSLHRGDLARRFANLQKMNEIEKRDEDIRALERERTLAEEKIQGQQAKLRQQFILISVSAVAIILLAGIAFVYARFFRKVKRLNKTIQENNESIKEQALAIAQTNAELEKLYHDVTEQKEEMQAQSEELAESYDQIREFNDNLQAVVDEKTRDLVRANEELLKQNGELQQFSYSVSHNLRGPLARIMGLATLAANAKQEQEAKQLNELIRKSSQDLDQVLRDLSKIIDVRNEFHRVREMVGLAEEWTRCVDLLRESIPPKTQFEIRFNDVSLFTIRAVVHSLFYNLLSNSIKYRATERDLKITVNVTPGDERTLIRFEDNGLGIDTEKYGDSLFKLFRRFHSHVEGRGIGLYLIKTQVESLNGSIRLTSQVGKGTRFEIELPTIVNTPTDPITQGSEIVDQQ